MFIATPTTRQLNTASNPEENEARDVIETRLWLEEHDWLYRLLRSEDNVSPTFRFPDLISASVSLVFTHQDAAARTPKTLAPETPSQMIGREAAVIPTESVAPAPLAQDPATEAESSRTVIVQFALGSAKLSPAARSQLNGAMSDPLQVRRIKITGRTDSTGPLTFNESLALARALAVRDHLRKTYPTLAATLTLQARGACCFIAPNDTVTGRTQNRRAEVVFQMSGKDMP